jgi:hypothetical protein
MDRVNHALAIVREERIVNVQIVPGVTVAARARQEGAFVVLDMAAQTPLGPVVGQFKVDIPTFERMVEKAVEHDVLPRARAFVERATGQRLLLKR